MKVIIRNQARTWFKNLDCIWCRQLHGSFANYSCTLDVSIHVHSCKEILTIMSISINCANARDYNPNIHCIILCRVALHTMHGKDRVPVIHDKLLEITLFSHRISWIFQLFLKNRKAHYHLNFVLLPTIIVSNIRSHFYRQELWYWLKTSSYVIYKNAEGLARFMACWSS